MKDTIRPALDETFTLRNNPLYSGSLMLNMLAESHTPSLVIANHHFSIFNNAHLYNAECQLVYLASLGLSWTASSRPRRQPSALTTFQ